jgi:peptidyl-prolyl cis-trans isomerase SurA
MIPKLTLTALRRAGAALMLGTAALSGASAIAPHPAQAQNLFDAVIKVNGDVITRYELEQRARLLTLLRAPADPNRLAHDQLIEDRLKLQAAGAQGLVISEEALLAGMTQFAAQGQLNIDQMIQLLERGGVSRETFREFVRVGLTWRELTQAKFGPRIAVSEEDLERARDAISSGTGVRVLLSEIIIPFTPETEAEVMERARSIAELTSTGAFSAQARVVSATPTRDVGGQLPWQSITDLPPILRPLVLGLAPGEVTEPLPLPGAVALFQMRDIQEVDAPAPEYAAIEYAAYYIPGGRSEEAIARARQIDAQTDTCDDLYGIAKGQPASILERGVKAPGEIPTDIAISLSRLDPGEVSYDVTRANGQTLVLLMMCGRSDTIEEEVTDINTAEAEAGEAETAAPDETTAQLSAQIASSRMESFANGYLEQLRSEARIIEY